MFMISVFIDPSAKVADDAIIGPWTRIGPNVSIGSGCVIGSHVVIERNTRIGANNRIHSFACIGGDPQDLSYAGEETWLEMGDGNVIREHVTINRGSARGEGVTKVGNKNCFLTSVHVAHDCEIGNEVLLVNHATLAGHVIVEDFAICGAFTAAHQFCRVGAYTFLSRATEISKDMPPYLLVAGIPGKPCGLNAVGLRRRGFSASALRGIKQAYRTLDDRNLKLEEAKQRIEAMVSTTPEVGRIVEFMNQSRRGLPRRFDQEMLDVEE